MAKFKPFGRFQEQVDRATTMRRAREQIEQDDASVKSFARAAYDYGSAHNNRGTIAKIIRDHDRAARVDNLWECYQDGTGLIGNSNLAVSTFDKWNKMTEGQRIDYYAGTVRRDVNAAFDRLEKLASDVNAYYGTNYDAHLVPSRLEMFISEFEVLMNNGKF